MATELAPVVAERLDAFWRRRAVLTVIRSLAVATTFLVIGLAVVAAVDWYWLVEDRFRWTASAMAYAVALVVGMTCVVGRIGRRRNKTDVARSMEEADPQLRESLLAAVELTTTGNDPIHDSVDFRQAVQNSAASKIANVRVGRLLPFGRIIKPIGVALAIVGAMAVWLVGGGDRARQLAARAALPGANIARVSRIQVDVLEPTAPALIVPENETVAVVVDVAGGAVGDVILETKTSDEERSRQSMWAQEEGHYVANVIAAAGTTRYRIRAGDARTRWFSIDAKPRPSVQLFQKRLTYPAYSQLPEKQLEETHGHIAALTGTKVSLTITANQPTSKAELRIVDSATGVTRVVELDQQDDSEVELAGRGSGYRLTTDLELDRNAYYQVALVSSETGFENEFSPRYQLQPLEDTAPRVDFVNQPTSELLLPPNDLLRLSGVSEDDLPIEQLTQRVSVNGGPWREIPLDGKAKTLDGRSSSARARHTFEADWQWDLLNYTLRPGDQVVTQLVATDRNGAVGESRPLNVIVAGLDFDPERHKTAHVKLGLVDELDDFAERLEETAVEIETLLETDPQAEAEVSPVDRGLEAAADLQGDADQLLTLLNETLTQLAAGPDAEDLALVGQTLARISHDQLQEVPYRATEAAIDSAPHKRQSNPEQRLARTLLNTAKLARQVALDYRTLATHNFLQALAVDLDTVAAQQEFVASIGTPDADRLLRQQTLGLNHLRAVAGFVRAHRGRVRNETAKRLDEYLRWIADEEFRLTTAMDDDGSVERIVESAKRLADQARSRSLVHNIDSGLPNEILRARARLRESSGSIRPDIEGLAAAADEYEEAVEATALAKDSAAAAELSELSDRVRAYIELTAQPRIAQLRVRRDLDQSRVDADSQYAHDAGLAWRAVNAVLRSDSQNGSKTTATDMNATADQSPLKQIAAAWHVLEAAHDLTASERTLQLLTVRERWDTQKVPARFDHPRLFERWQQGVEQTARVLRESSVQHDAVGKLDSLRWSELARRSQDKITTRRWNQESAVSAFDHLSDLEIEHAGIRTALQPFFEDARAVIAQFAPTIPQMARATAEQMRESQADESPTSDQRQPQQSAEQAAVELQQKQPRIDEQLAELVQALTEEANRKDMRDADERAVARDADDSIELIRDRSSEMDAAIRDLANATQPDELAETLDQAREAQSDAADALDLIAEHFERMQADQPIAETRDQLRSLEQELGVARMLDERYEPLETETRSTQQSAEERLAELERELASNPAMQEALADISAETVQEAQRALNQAAAEDDRIQRENERSDSSFREQKRLVASALRNLADQSSQVANRLVNEAQQAANRGQANEAAEQLQQARRDLENAADTARQVNEDLPLAKLQNAASEVAENLAAAKAALEQAQRAAASAKESPITDDERRLANQRRDETRSQEQFLEQLARDANSNSRRADDRLRQRDRDVANAERAVSSADRRLNDALRNARKRPDDTGSQRRAQQEKQRLTDARAKLAAARAQRDAAAQQAEAARQQAAAIASKQPPELEQANPSAELAERYAADATERSRQLQDQANAVVESMQFGETLTPAAPQLAASQDRQENITEDLEAIAERLRRAARHEQRLQSTQTSTALAQNADQVDAVAVNQSSKASDALQAASEVAADSSSATKQRQETAAAAQQNAAAAETAIAATAEQLGAMLAANEALASQGTGEAPEGSAEPAAAEAGASTSPTKTSPSDNSGPLSSTGQASNQSPSSATPQQGSPSTSSAAQQAAALTQGKQLAQALDELDRVMHSDQSGSGESTQVPTGVVSNASLPTSAAQQAASQRTAAQRETLASLEGGLSPAEGANLSDADSGPFELAPVARNDKSEWGALREKSAEEVTASRSAAVSEAYRSRVEAYFRALAERAKEGR